MQNNNRAKRRRIAPGIRAIASSLALFAAIGTAPAPAAGDEIGQAIHDVPIFDAHMHYKIDAWDRYPASTVIELMDKTGVAMALVSSTPDEGTIKLWEYAPRRIVPEMRPYFGAAGSANWTKSEGMLAFIRQRLDKYPHQGIGEFHIHVLDIRDRPFLRAVAKIAKDRNILIHIHSTAAPVRLFYEFEPDLTIIWAHAGMTEPPEVVGAMFDEYPTLYADTSYRESDILTGEGTIAPAWRAVILKHADRLMVGTDTWVNSQWEKYEELVAFNRLWLARLPRDVAERIAYKNAEKLFKRKISRDLLGAK
ncbi:MAG: amidohydrolase [Alphaproteobacteria bacterium]|nr:amidohydrolase [Alphaproteobacteria bacterium]